MSELARLRGLGPKRLQALELSGLATLRDLVYHIPRHYLDRTRFRPLSETEPGQEAYALVTVEEATFFSNRLIVKVVDGSTSLDLVFFQGLPYLKGRFRAGQRLSIAGMVTSYRGLQIAHPEFTVLDGDANPQPQGLLPRYPLTEAMSEARVEHKLLNSWALEALEKFSFSDPLTPDLKALAKLPGEAVSLSSLHAPSTLEEAASALNHLKLRELLPLFQTVENRRRARMGVGIPFRRNGDLEARFLAALPFALTAGQRQIAAALADALEGPGQYTGLLQADVGAGKTVVAALVALTALAAGAQVAFMAPTEILANQHWQTLSPWFIALGYGVALLTGEVQGQEREALVAGLSGGQIQVIIGTHALLSEPIVFRRLGLAIVDEQHRFGVKQREALSLKGEFPHILYLSATPIPRTLAQTVYGELEVSSLMDKPPGRLPVKTRLVQRDKLRDMLAFLQKEVAQGNQVFWVVPRINGPGHVPDPVPGMAGKEIQGQDGLRGVEEVLRELSAFSDQWAVEAIHGRMNAEKRAAALARFRLGSVQVLVATTVIEVGVDIPQANIMVIEGPDRFGLAQLHQLRGRTGRGQEQAWCFLLLPQACAPESETRLRAFAEIEDGFKLAEMDLLQRGAGHLDGTVQSGFGGLRFTDLVVDKEWVDLARNLVRQNGGLPPS